MVVVIVHINDICSVLFKEESDDIGTGFTMSIHHGKMEGITALVFLFGDAVGVALEEDFEYLVCCSVGTCVVHR